MRKNELQSHQNTPEEAESYANIAICKTQAGERASLSVLTGFRVLCFSLRRVVQASG